MAILAEEFVVFATCRVACEELDSRFQHVPGGEVFAEGGLIECGRKHIR
jgi:hypothetical protein